MRNLLAGLLALPLLGAAPAAVPPVAYSLTPVFSGKDLTALAVKVRFRVKASGVTEFGWQKSWAGDDKLWRWARDLTVEGAQSVEDEGQGRRRIHAAPGAAITVRYRIVSAYDRDPTPETSQQTLPAIRPGWFFTVGESLFAEPYDQETAPATFAWTGAPAGFSFASDLEHLAGPGRHATRPGTVRDILESIAIGGRDLHLSGSLTAPSRVRVASVGAFAFSPAELDALARQVIAVERRFWGEDDSKPFLVAAMPLRRSPAQQAFSGTGRTDAFALWIDETMPLDSITWLLGHEYFHTWNPGALGGFPDSSALDPATRYWFSEGFTDYYARALLLRAGLISPADFAAQWNESLTAYAASPLKTTPNARAAPDFWKTQAGEKLPYQRGAMLAAIWNARLRAATGGKTGLDEVMHAQRTAARTPKAGQEADTLFPTVARRYGLDVDADLTRFVDRGEAIVLPPGVFGPCARVVTKTRPVFAYGFDAATTMETDMVVRGVDPTSKAYAAGLRDGMKILKKEAGTAGDSTTSYVLQVDDHGARRTITYLPQGLATLSVQQVRLAPKLGPQCRRTLSGL